MSKINKVTCDRCGNVADQVRNFMSAGYSPPDKWTVTSEYNDLCPKCAKAYKKVINKFVSNHED